MCGYLKESFLAVLNHTFEQIFLFHDTFGPFLLHDLDSEHVLAEVGENVCLVKQNLLLPHAVIEERINPSNEFINNVLLMIIQNVIKPHIVFFEAVKERCISCLEALIIFVHKYYRMEALMDEALRV